MQTESLADTAIEAGDSQVLSTSNKLSGETHTFSSLAASYNDVIQQAGNPILKPTDCPTNTSFEY